MADGTPTSSAGIYEIDPRKMLPYEAAAQVLTLLAFPPEGPPNAALEQRYEETCAWVIRRLAERDALWASEPRALRPMHALISPERVATLGRTVKTELNRRLAAGRMAVAFIDEAMLGEATLRLPPGVKRLSLNQLAAYAAGNGDASNVETRAFRPSVPVLHLCVALAWVRALLGERRDNDSSVVDFLISDMDVLRAFVDAARDFEAPLLASTRLQTTPDKLVRVRWVGD